MTLFSDTLVLLKGAGDLGTGVAWRLHRAGFPIVITELAEPLVVRRTVAFASAVDQGEITVEGVTARRATFEEAPDLIARGIIAVVVDPQTRVRELLSPAVLVDAVLAKRNTGTRMTDAPLVIALGPGFTPGVDCHAVVETNRGHFLGRVWWDRPTEPDTGGPGDVGGKSAERVLRAPRDGIVKGIRQIGDTVKTGEALARIMDPVENKNGAEVLAPFDGIVRGLIRDGMVVHSGTKIGDVDPRARREACFTISDKSLAVGGAVLEAILYWQNRQPR